MIDFFGFLAIDYAGIEQRITGEGKRMGDNRQWLKCHQYFRKLDTTERLGLWVTEKPDWRTVPFSANTEWQTVDTPLHPSAAAHQRDQRDQRYWQTLLGEGNVYLEAA